MFFVPPGKYGNIIQIKPRLFFFFHRLSNSKFNLLFFFQFVRPHKFKTCIYFILSFKLMYLMPDDGPYN